MKKWGFMTDVLTVSTWGKLGGRGGFLLFSAAIPLMLSACGSSAYMNNTRITITEAEAAEQSGDESELSAARAEFLENLSALSPDDFTQDEADGIDITLIHVEGGNKIIQENARDAVKEEALAKLEEIGLDGIEDFVKAADAETGKNRYVYGNQELYLNVLYNKERMGRGGAELEILLRNLSTLPQERMDLIDELWAQGLYVSGYVQGGREDMLSFSSENFIAYTERYFWEDDAAAEGEVSEYPFRLWLYGDKKAERLRFAVVKPYYESFDQVDFTNLAEVLKKFCGKDIAEEVSANLAAAVGGERFRKEISADGVTASISKRDVNILDTESIVAEVVIGLGR